MWHDHSNARIQAAFHTINIIVCICIGKLDIADTVASLQTNCSVRVFTQHQRVSIILFRSAACCNGQFSLIYKGKSQSIVSKRFCNRI